MPKVYVSVRHRSEDGMSDPIIRRLKDRRWYSEDWQAADLCIIPGDRREQMRVALDCYERGTPIWHLGSGDQCEGDGDHYDGTYRKLIAGISSMNLGLDRFCTTPLLFSGEFDDCDAVGPTMIDDLPDTSKHPEDAPPIYDMGCSNRLPWEKEEIFIPTSNPIVTMNPGDGRVWVNANAPMIFLPALPRYIFLRYLRHARNVYGNSSCLFYEAPLWHEDGNIIQMGKRNRGRKIVRWDSAKYGCPSDNVMKLLEEHFK